MTTIATTTQIDELLKEGKMDEAKTLITELAQADLTSQEKGASLINLGAVYMEVSNRINERYLQVLEDTIAALEAIEAAENRVNDQVKLKEVQGSLGM